MAANWPQLAPKSLGTMARTLAIIAANLEELRTKTEAYRDNATDRGSDERADELDAKIDAMERAMDSLAEAIDALEEVA